MSKISFWNSVKENAKRRIWVAVLAVIVLAIFYPLVFAMIMQIEGMDSDVSYRTTRALYLFHQNLVGIGIAIVGAVICGIEGYSYLYSRQKVDVFESEPVSKRRRFFTIYTYGILVYVIPLLVFSLICIPVAHIYHAFSMLFLSTLVSSLCQCLLVYLAVYHLTIMAVMLTGHLVVTMLMTGFLMLFEFAFRLLFSVMKETFFVSYYNVNSRITDSFTSPIIAAYRLVECNSRLPQSYAVRKGFISGDMSYYMVAEKKYLMLLVAQAAIYLAIAFWCYMKRPMEKNGEALIFEKIKGPFKVLVVFFGGLLGAMIFHSMTYENGVFTFIGMVLGLLLMQIAVEVIYDFDIKSALKHWNSLCVAAILCVGVYGIFSMDVFGYDHYVPNKASLKDISISVDFDNAYEINHFEPSLDGIFFQHLEESARLDSSNMDAVDAILDLAAHNTGKKVDEYINSEDQESLGNAYFWVTVKYTKKSGREIYRYFCINPLQGDDKKDMEAIFAAKSMKEELMNLHGENIEKLWEISKPYYNDGFEDHTILASDATAMMEAYREDFDAMTWEQAVGVPVGLVKIRYKGVGDYNHYASYPVFEGFTNTIAYLESKDISVENTIDVENIANIGVTKYESQYNEEGMWVRDGNSEKTFTDAKSIQNIVKHAHPRELLSWRFVDYPWTTDFSVNILYKNELTQSDLSVLRGDLPAELDKEWDAEVLWNDDDWN